jgi:hypothetical protein
VLLVVLTVPWQVRSKQLDIAGVEEQVAKLDSMLKEARAQTDKVQKEYNAMSEKVRPLRGAGVAVGMLHDGRCTSESALTCSDEPGCCLQISKLHHDLEEAIHTNTQLLADSSSRQVELRGKEEELAALRLEIQKVIKVCCRWWCVSWWWGVGAGVAAELTHRKLLPAWSLTAVGVAWRGVAGLLDKLVPNACVPRTCRSRTRR